jgi:uncharacterized protein (DUF305 family)
MKKTLVALALVALAGLTLTACGDQTDTTGTDANPAASTTSDAAFNDADVAFAQRMVLHHQQAVVMARMADDRVDDPAVEQLAADIEAAQTPEIEQMEGWLKSWGKEVPDSMMGDYLDGDSDGDWPGMMGDNADGDWPGMMGGHGPGMMSWHQMGMLNHPGGWADGRSWDDMFLTMMIAHHRGAIAMAEQELEDGTNPDALALAQKIITAQRAEIATMKELLAD